MAGQKNRDCCYAEMSGNGKQGGQSITKVDNSIHSQYWNEPYTNDYENTRKSFYGPQGVDWSKMENK